MAGSLNADCNVCTCTSLLARGKSAIWLNTYYNIYSLKRTYSHSSADDSQYLAQPLPQNLVIQIQLVTVTYTVFYIRKIVPTQLSLYLFDLKVKLEQLHPFCVVPLLLKPGLQLAVFSE